MARYIRHGWLPADEDPDPYVPRLIRQDPRLHARPVMTLHNTVTNCSLWKFKDNSVQIVGNKSEDQAIAEKVGFGFGISTDFLIIFVPCLQDSRQSPITKFDITKSLHIKVFQDEVNRSIANPVVDILRARHCH